MAAKPEPVAVRRILVAMDSITDNLWVMESAVDLAVRMEADLTGLFVEDTDLLQAADLPVSWEVMSWTARERSPTASEMVRSLRALATRFQEDLARVAGRASVRWSFRTVRGRRIQTLIAAGEEADMTLIGPARFGAARWYHSQPSARPMGRIVVLDVGTASSQRALLVATRLAESGGGALTLIRGGAGRDQVAAVEAATTSGRRGPVVRLVQLEDAVTGETLVESLGRLEIGTLILPADADLAQDPELFQRLQARVGRPILLVR